MVLKRALLNGWLAMVALGIGTADATTLLTRDWPVARECGGCLRLQFRRLELLLPSTEVSKVFTTGSGGPALDLVPASGDLRDSVSIFDRTQGRLRDLFKRTDFLDAHGIRTPRDYWDALGKEPAADDKYLAMARKAERIDRAHRYTRLSRGVLTAYIVDAAEPEDRRIYFVIDGDETYYMLVGPMSASFVEAVLSNARAVEMP